MTRDDRVAERQHHDHTKSTGLDNVELDKEADLVVRGQEDQNETAENTRNESNGTKDRAGVGETAEDHGTKDDGNDEDETRGDVKDRGLEFIEAHSLENLTVLDPNAALEIDDSGVEEEKVRKGILESLDEPGRTKSASRNLDKSE